MEQSDFLTSAAQIAVGLAGFTGVASAFSNGPADVPPAVQAERLRAMIEAALVAVIFSLTPMLLSDLQLPVEVLWRLASGCYLVASVLTFTLILRRGFKVLRAAQLTAQRSWGAVVAAISIVAIGALLSGACGFHSSSCYLFALLLQIILCALLFTVASLACGVVSLRRICTSSNAVAA